MADVRARLRAFLGELLGLGKGGGVSDSEDLLSGGLDSMGILRLTVFVEEQFGVRVPDETVVPENVRTLDALVRWVETLR